MDGKNTSKYKSREIVALNNLTKLCNLFVSEGRITEDRKECILISAYNVEVFDGSQIMSGNKISRTCHDSCGKLLGRGQEYGKSCWNAKGKVNGKQFHCEENSGKYK